MASRVRGYRSRARRVDGVWLGDIVTVLEDEWAEPLGGRNRFLAASALQAAS